MAARKKDHNPGQPRAALGYLVSPICMKTPGSGTPEHLCFGVLSRRQQLQTSAAQNDTSSHR
jgi:hypothetical protein